jgi:hypothetical protein
MPPGSRKKYILREKGKRLDGERRSFAVLIEMITYTLVLARSRIIFPILMPAWGITNSDGFRLYITAVERGRCFLSKEK